MLLGSESFTEINPTAEQSDLNYGQANVVLDAAPAMVLLDASSLNTVLAMLEVIDSVEELALLETLTPEQKRQVWDATPDVVRARLKQLRTQPPPQTELSPKTGLISEAPSGSGQDLGEENGLEQAGFYFTFDATATDQADDPEEINAQTLDAEASEPDPVELDSADLETDLLVNVNLTPPIQLKVGDWVVLQARPKLTSAELVTIWEVLEVRSDSVQIFSSQLGTRIYPSAWMLIYPKPIGYSEPEF